MDFRFTPEEEAFRQEIRDFWKKELPPDFVGYEMMEQDEDDELASRITRKMHERGWITMAWPKEYGGMAASYMHQSIFAEEKTYFRAHFQEMGGPAHVLMSHGTQEQKDWFLPRMARGELKWCLGLSEPGVGSDLASVQTRAVEDGDDFVINGTKIWTSGAHKADWMTILARTDPDAPKHRGLSFLLLDMKTPGITIRPVINMAGGHRFNQEFFDNVRVSKTNLIGEKNAGWYVNAANMDTNRGGVERSAWSRRALDDLIQVLRTDPYGQQIAATRPQVAYAVSDRYIEANVARLLSYNVTWMQSKGLQISKEASISKVFGTETYQRVARTGIQVLGPYGVIKRGVEHSMLNALYARLFLLTFSQTIGAGTSEIMRNIIAQRGLGLPRD